MSNATWKNRWKITATLTTETSLHIGGDLPRERDIYPMVAKDKKKKEKVEVTSVVTDVHGKPYIPGSTIKGNLRSWMKNHGYAGIGELFGSDHTVTDQKGGKVEFCDAFWDEKSCTFGDDKQPPWWDPERLTGIAASVAIDRATGTACDKKLFHLEYIPKGVSFTLTLTGQDLNDDEVGSILHAISNGFEDKTQPITLGASTANGWGKFTCKIDSVEKLDATKVKEWLKSPQKAGYDIPMERTFQWDTMLKIPSTSVNSKLLTIDVELHFAGLFLVNDHSRSKKVRGDDHLADMNPRRDSDGKVNLPSASFRGAFRSQAERIVRTMGKDACSPKKTCKAIGKKGEEDGLCIACRTFGAAGWKTPLAISDFEQINDAQTLDQEFVAIDRFTGGSRASTKFNARGFVDPVLKGSISIDTSRISPAEAGLLALVLRDLIEGDIAFGFGSAKGYGSCTAKVVSATLPNSPDWLHKHGMEKIDWKDGDDHAPLRKAAACFVQTFCEVAQ